MNETHRKLINLAHEQAAKACNPSDGTDDEKRIWRKHQLCTRYQRRMIALYGALIPFYLDKTIVEAIAAEWNISRACVRAVWQSRCANRCSEPDPVSYLTQVKEAYRERREQEDYEGRDEIKREGFTL